MRYPKVVLKPGKEKSIISNRHPWIFSGAIQVMPELSAGDIADVYSSSGQFLARGYFHPENSIAGRVLSFSEQDIETVIRTKIEDAYHLRKSVIRPDTSCYRVVNSEADGLPGLVVDRYSDVFVIQVNTCGMDKLKDLVLKTILEVFSPRSVYEKSVSSAREIDGLAPFEGCLVGEPIEEVIVEENGVQFFVSITEGQKTGLFLDHREMRRLVSDLSKDKKVLNCFAYTGGFSLYALKGGARHVTSVDISESACRYAGKNSHLNQFPSDSHTVVVADVFDFLLQEQDWDYDIVIIDPPAFAKKRKDMESATIGYRKLNSLVLSKVKKGAIVITSSCSYFIDKEAFQRIVFQAGSAAKRDVRILQHHILSLDHPLSLYHPEGDYLKSLVLYVS